MITSYALVCLVLSASFASAGEIIFQDSFSGRLGPGWSWIREQPEGWRLTDQGLQIRVQPGNMWGAANNATNVLVRPLPLPDSGGLEISVRVENQPTEQYEQMDLVWYYNESHMVKIGQELVDGKLSVVMGREEKDRTRTIAIIALGSFAVDLRLVVLGNQIQGFYRPDKTQEWLKAGACELPAPEGGKAQASLQAYQGPQKVERWGRFTRFQVKRAPQE